MAFGDVRHDEHGIPLKHESESAVLPFERSVHLHDAALIAQHLGASAMDIAGIEEAVSMPPQPLFWLVAVSLGCCAATWTRNAGLGADSNMDMDF